MRMLAEDELRDAVLLIFANKQVNFCFVFVFIFVAWFESKRNYSNFSPFFIWCVCLFIVGSTECNECSRNYRQVRTTFITKSKLVHSSHMCNKRWWSIWGSRLVIQSIEKFQPLRGTQRERERARAKARKKNKTTTKNIQKSFVSKRINPLKALLITLLLSYKNWNMKMKTEL